MGNFVFDFDEKENLVGMEITDASEVLSKLVSKFLELTNIKELKAEVVNFRNIVTIQLVIITEKGRDTANIIVPRIKQETSPALIY
jgi:hypothetical protein